jgi:hypothetical protein
MTGARTRMLTSRLTATGALNDHDVDAQGIEVDASIGAISKARHRRLHVERGQRVSRPARRA